MKSISPAILKRIITQSCMEVRTTGNIYIIKHFREDMYKIGHTIDFRQRSVSLRRYYETKSLPIHIIKASDSGYIERILHKIFNDKRVPESDELGREWFLLDQEDFDWIISIKAVDTLKFKRLLLEETGIQNMDQLRKVGLHW